jgi:hypothetical protein
MEGPQCSQRSGADVGAPTELGDRVLDDSGRDPRQPACTTATAPPFGNHEDGHAVGHGDVSSTPCSLVRCASKPSMSVKPGGRDRSSASRAWPMDLSRVDGRHPGRFPKHAPGSRTSPTGFRRTDRSRSRRPVEAAPWSPARARESVSASRGCTPERERRIAYQNLVDGPHVELSRQGSPTLASTRSKLTRGVPASRASTRRRRSHPSPAEASNSLRDTTSSRSRRRSRSSIRS